jgi:hypothetical protein
MGDGLRVHGTIWIGALGVELALGLGRQFCGLANPDGAISERRLVTAMRRVGSMGRMSDAA